MELIKVAKFLEYATSSRGLGDLCNCLRLPSGGAKREKAQRILSVVTTWDQVAGLLTLDMLRTACDAYRLSRGGSKAELLQRVCTFVEGASAEMLASPSIDVIYDHNSKDLSTASLNGRVLDRASDEGGSHPEPMFPPQKLEVTRENILRVLSELRLRSSIRNEYHAQNEIFDALIERFGDGRIGRELKIGGYTLTRVDLDIDKTYGLEVKYCGSLLKEVGGHATEVERLLGQLILYRKHYQPENIFVLVAGEVEPQQKPILREIGKLVEEQRGVLIHIPLK